MNRGYVLRLERGRVPIKRRCVHLLASPAEGAHNSQENSHVVAEDQNALCILYAHGDSCSQLPNEADTERGARSLFAITEPNALRVKQRAARPTHRAHG